MNQTRVCFGSAAKSNNALTQDVDCDSVSQETCQPVEVYVTCNTANRLSTCSGYVRGALPPSDVMGRAVHLDVLPSFSVLALSITPALFIHLSVLLTAPHSGLFLPVFAPPWA